MNRIAFASILLSALLTCCAVCLFWLHQDISALDTALSRSESLTAQQDYDAAIAVLKEATVVWGKRQRLHSRLLRHKELENITLTLISLPAYLEHESLPDYEAGIQQVHHMLEHIWESELPVWQNLL